MHTLNNSSSDKKELFASHIYVEEKIEAHPLVQRIRERFKEAEYVNIGHYKDIFCRQGQNTALQEHQKNIILARKEGTLVYEGAPVCQSFGHRYFYYTSCVMNCVYNCEYCYLKGMYPSANLVIFVNPEDIFAQVEQILKEHPVYLCVSYDTDLLAIESLTGFVSRWIEFTRQHPELTIEIRTKCANRKLFRELPVCERVIYAFTISPQPVTEQFEMRTPSMEARISCAGYALEQGHNVRLCFDPMLYFKDWREAYGEMLKKIREQIPDGALTDASVGSFRISKSYLKSMRKRYPDSAVIQFPYELQNGYYQYEPALVEEMEGYLTKQLQMLYPTLSIFRW